MLAVALAVMEKVDMIGLAELSIQHLCACCPIRVAISPIEFCGRVWECGCYINPGLCRAGDTESTWTGALWFRDPPDVLKHTSRYNEIAALQLASHFGCILTHAVWKTRFLLKGLVIVLASRRP
jgi:hypothetical protein